MQLVIADMLNGNCLKRIYRHNAQMYQTNKACLQLCKVRQNTCLLCTSLNTIVHFPQKRRSTTCTLIKNVKFICYWIADW